MRRGGARGRRLRWRGRWGSGVGGIEGGLGWKGRDGETYLIAWCWEKGGADTLVLIEGLLLSCLRGKGIFVACAYLHGLYTYLQMADFCSYTYLAVCPSGWLAGWLAVLSPKLHAYTIIHHHLTLTRPRPCHCKTSPYTHDEQTTIAARAVPPTSSTTRSTQ